MQYIAEIKAFQGFAQDKSLSTGQIALWYALMYINNKCMWEPWFTVASLSLEINTGLSRQGVVKSRAALKQHGLIDFSSNNTKSAAYKMQSRLNSSQESVQDSSHENSQGCIQNSVQSGVQTSVQNCIPLTIQHNTTLHKTKRDGKTSPTKAFEIPTVEEVTNYCKQRNNQVNPQSFVNFYQSKGWMVGRNPMTNWQSAVNSWETKVAFSPKKPKNDNYYDFDELENMIANPKRSASYDIDELEHMIAHAKI